MWREQEVKRVSLLFPVVMSEVTHKLGHIHATYVAYQSLLVLVVVFTYLTPDGNVGKFPLVLLARAPTHVNEVLTYKIIPS